MAESLRDPAELTSYLQGIERERANLRKYARAYIGSDPNKAVELNREFLENMKTWKALPFWRRWITKRPQPATGI